MLLNARSISVSVAVICFFGVAVIGWFSKLSPFTCCKRALTAAFVAYVVTNLAVKAINSILINAMTETQMNQQEGRDSDNGD